MNLIELEKVLQKSWSKETSACSAEWDESNPALGQCAITALIVNDYFGCDIIWAEAVLPNGKKSAHFFNYIDNKEVDLTRSQFPQGTVIPVGPVGVEKKKDFATRDFLFQYENKNSRYELLKENVNRNLNKRQ